MDLINNLNFAVVVGIFSMIFSIGYSIYMAILNKKQSRVIEKLDETNSLLKDLKDIIKEMKK